MVDLDIETHGGDDVMVFARGPWAHLFIGNYEQNEIPVALAMAAGISTNLPSTGGAGSNNAGLARFNFAEQTILLACLLVGLMGVNLFD